MVKTLLEYMCIFSLYATKNIILFCQKLDKHIFLIFLFSQLFSVPHKIHCNETSEAQYE